MPRAISLTNPVIISGAGITGLVLAHALQKSRVPFLIYDREGLPSNMTHKGSGWAISIHWAQSALQECLSASVFERIINETQVLPPGEDKAKRRFLFLDLETCTPRFEIEAADVLRVRRGVFRDVLADVGQGGIYVEKGRRMCGFKEVKNEDGVAVEVEFEVEGDGEEGDTRRREIVRGAMLVGADGIGSLTRQLLCPETWALEKLPVRMLGVTARLTADEVAPLQEIDSMLFQGCHPVTGTFMWFSIISTPVTNGSSSSSSNTTTSKPFFEAQINLSWRINVSAPKEDTEIPESNDERLDMMKHLAHPFEERLRTVIQNLPDKTPVTAITLQDWPCVEWPNHGGRVTLIGDAAHAMTMYRGEACNHAIHDAHALHAAILSIYKGEISQSDAIDAFDAEVALRAREGVLLSRHACLDAHDLGALRVDSPLVAGRGVVRTAGREIS